MIPYSDERLKPRRTKSKIAFSLFLCSIIIGVMTYIFLPGKVIVTTTNMTIVSASIVDNRAPTNEHGIYSIDKPVNRSKITWMVGVNVINKNRFLPITVNELKLNLTWNVSILNVTFQCVWYRYVLCFNVMYCVFHHESDIYVTIATDNLYCYSQALDEINVGYSVTGNFTVQAHQTYNSSIIIETPQDNGKYQDWLLTCKCCRRFSHNRCSMDLHMFSLISLRYSLHIGQFNYFSDFASSRTPGHDNCNYFYNIDYGHRVKNLTCQTYEECHVNSGLGTYF